MIEQTVTQRPEIRGHAAVRAAAKDVGTYSSDLQGDRDVRTYRQLPLEVDPPLHTLFRKALQPLFSGTALAPHLPSFEALARQLIARIGAKGGGEISSELALPYAMGCLGIIYRRPQDVEEWVSWGPDVWTADAYARGELTAESYRALRERDFGAASQRSGVTLQAYLERVFATAEDRLATDPAEPDVWDQIARLEIDGCPVTREEMYGIANVLLAGGRDTVVKLTTGIVWHLTNNPQDRGFLADNPDAYNRAIAELVRYLTPLPKMERIRRDPLADGEDDYVLLSFVSANYDHSVWPDADRLDIHRQHNPHLGFGFGPHACLGITIAQYEAKALLGVLVNEWPNWEFDGEPEIDRATEQGVDGPIEVIDRFVAVRVRTRTE